MPNLMNDAELIVETNTDQQQDNQTPTSQLSPSEREYRAMSPHAQHRKDMGDIQAHSNRSEETLLTSRVD